jgi:hypothetical protein
MAIPTNILAEDLLLKCADSSHTRYFLVSPDKSQVQLVDTEEADICDLKVLPHMYIWNCPKTDNRRASLGKTNRFSGWFENEIGEPPYGEMFSNNLFFVGSCEKMAADPKY